MEVEELEAKGDSGKASGSVRGSPSWLPNAFEGQNSRMCSEEARGGMPMEDDGVVAERKNDHTGEHIDLVGVEDDRVAERRNDHTGEHKTLAGVGRILVEVGRGLAGVDTHSFGRDREYTVVKLVGDNTQIVGEDKRLDEEL